MRKRIVLLFALLSCSISARGEDLAQVYQQALRSDAIFQQAMAQNCATKEGVPIAVGALFPNIAFKAMPYILQSSFSGTNTQIDPNTGLPLTPTHLTTRGYTMNLTATQTVFDFAQFARVAEAFATAKGADATLNAALQSLIVRVANAYFAVLKDEDNLIYAEASKVAYAQQLDQVREQYRVGLKTLTNVYTAQASYDSASADYFEAKTTLLNDRENLRVITGVYYPHLASLREDFPLITPKPANVETWVEIAQRQNWTIKASQFAVETARQVIKENFAGHLPTINLQGNVNKYYANNISAGNSLTEVKGPSAQIDKQIAVNINVPIFSGGTVIAQTNQAAYNFHVKWYELEQTVRETINTTRQSFQSLLLGKSQIHADRQAIKSNASSLEGMEASYRVGTETLVNVLNQQQKVYQSLTQYSADRYAFVNNILALKQAAGTLSFEDLVAINCWLTDKKQLPASMHQLRRNMQAMNGTVNPKNKNKPKEKNKKMEKKKNLRYKGQG